MSDEKWEAPVVVPGDTVYRCPDGTRRGVYPAIVVKSSGRTINMWEIGGHFYEGVRHIDDPMLNDAQIETFGCWALSRTGERILELEQQVKSLTEQVTILSAASKKPAGIPGRAT